jgi:hypothetical protein
MWLKEPSLQTQNLDRFLRVETFSTCIQKTPDLQVEGMLGSPPADLQDQALIATCQKSQL